MSGKSSNEVTTPPKSPPQKNGEDYAAHAHTGTRIHTRAYLSRGELHAVDAALLPGPDAHHLPALRVPHGVGLRVLGADGGHHEVALGFLGEGALRADVLQRAPDEGERDRIGRAPRVT